MPSRRRGLGFTRGFKPGAIFSTRGGSAFGGNCILILPFSPNLSNKKPPYLVSGFSYINPLSRKNPNIAGKLGTWGALL